MAEKPPPPDEGRCTALNKKGDRCRAWRREGFDLCWAHSDPERHRSVSRLGGEKSWEFWRTVRTGSARVAPDLPLDDLSQAAAAAADMVRGMPDAKELYPDEPFDVVTHQERWMRILVDALKSIGEANRAPIEVQVVLVEPEGEPPE